MNNNKYCYFYVVIPWRREGGIDTAGAPVSFSLQTLSRSFLWCHNVPGCDAGSSFHSRDLALEVKHCSTCIVYNYTIYLTLFWGRMGWQSILLQVCTMSPETQPEWSFYVNTGMWLDLQMRCICGPYVGQWDCRNQKASSGFKWSAYKSMWV